MKTHPKKQITVICEMPVVHLVTGILDAIKVSGYTVIPALSGKGSEGAWDRDQWIGIAGRMVMIVSIMSGEQAEVAIDKLYEAIEPQMGIITVADVAVLRSDRF